MVLSILIPEINLKPTNTKDAVISILTIEWPISLRNIYYKIKKQYGFRCSYQAVFKAVKELTEIGVLLEKDKKYEINIEWIKRVQSFTDIVETNYYAKERVQNLSGLKDSKQKSDIMVLNFETIFDAEKYLYYFMKSELFKTKNDTVCYQINHEWRPIFYLRAEYNYYKRLMKKGHKFYFVCSGKSDIEKRNAEFYKSIGVDFKFTKQKFSNDLLIFGDYLMHIYIPHELRENMEKLIKNNDSISLLKTVLEKKSSIRVVVTRDAALTEEMKKQIK